MLTQNAPPKAQVERFAADFLSASRAGETDRIGIAVSGGPDSMALLLLANCAFPGRVAAATVNHGLRRESAREAAAVAAQCVALGLQHTTLKVSPPANKRNTSAWAREARYDALDSWAERDGLDWLLTAHHADDQLETVIMRLNRGAGVGGLSGVRARRGRIVRPLLGWRRAELLAIVTAAGLTVVDDPTNRDDRFDRARLRKMLADTDWIDRTAVAQSAAALDQADQALDWAVERLAHEVLTRDAGAVLLTPTGLPHELVRRLALKALSAIDVTSAPRGPALEKAVAALHEGRVISIGAVIGDGRHLPWRFTAAPPRRTAA